MLLLLLYQPVPDKSFTSRTLQLTMSWCISHAVHRVMQACIINMFSLRAQTTDASLYLVAERGQQTTDSKQITDNTHGADNRQQRTTDSNAQQTVEVVPRPPIFFIHSLTVMRPSLHFHFRAYSIHPELNPFIDPESQSPRISMLRHVSAPDQLQNSSP